MNIPNKIPEDELSTDNNSDIFILDGINYIHRGKFIYCLLLKGFGWRYNAL